MTDRLLLTIDEAAERLSLSVSSFNTLLREGKIVAIRPLGGDRRIAVMELERFVKDQQEAASAEQAANIRLLREQLGFRPRRQSATGKTKKTARG